MYHPEQNVAVNTAKECLVAWMGKCKFTLKTNNNWSITHVRKPRDFSHFPPACRTTIRNFVRWLPKFPGCADNPKFGSQQRPRGNWYEHKPSDQRVAIEYPLIQYNYKRVWHWLGFDLDYAVKTAPRFPWVAENELNLPVPHLVMESKQRSRSRAVDVGHTSAVGRSV